MTTGDTHNSRSHRDFQARRGGAVRRALLALGLALPAAASCDRNGPVDPDSVARITIKPSIFGFLVGSREQFHAYAVTVSGVDVQLAESAGSFVSRKPEVFTVTSQGLATAVRTGEGWLVASFLLGDKVRSDSLKLTILTW